MKSAYGERPFDSNSDGARLRTNRSINLLDMKAKPNSDTAVLPRRTAHGFLKRFGEGACGFVAKGLRDL